MTPKWDVDRYLRKGNKSKQLILEILFAYKKICKILSKKKDISMFIKCLIMWYICKARSEVVAKQ